jgi:hypothetical protein
MYPKPVGPVSHARRVLIDLIEARRLTPTLAGWGMGKNSVMAYYEAALGRTPPSYGVIFALRERISAELWFYDETEKPPEPVRYRIKYPSTGKGVREKILTDETAALGKIREIREKRELPAFCARYGVKYTDLWGVCSKRMKADGRYGFHQRPPYRVVRSLREVIHPALWYIFPDELCGPPLSVHSFI